MHSQRSGDVASSAVAWDVNRTAQFLDLQTWGVWRGLCGQPLWGPAVQKADNAGRARKKASGSSWFPQPPGRVCLHEARSTNSPAQLPLIPDRSEVGFWSIVDLSRDDVPS